MWTVNDKPYEYIPMCSNSRMIKLMASSCIRSNPSDKLIAGHTGGVSYSNFILCHTNLIVCHTNFWQILDFSGLKMSMLTLNYTMVSDFNTSWTDFHRVCTKTIGQYHFCPTNFAKETPTHGWSVVIARPVWMNTGQVGQGMAKWLSGHTSSRGTTECCKTTVNISQTTVPANQLTYSTFHISCALYLDSSTGNSSHATY